MRVILGGQIGIEMMLKKGTFLGGQNGIEMML